MSGNARLTIVFELYYTENVSQGQIQRGGGGGAGDLDPKRKSKVATGFFKN